MRPFARTIYGTPLERVIGSALGLDFDVGGDDTRLVYKSKIEFFDDGRQRRCGSGAESAAAHWWPGANSNGDIPMLRFARTGERAALRLLVPPGMSTRGRSLCIHPATERPFPRTLTVGHTPPGIQHERRVSPGRRRSRPGPGLGGLQAEVRDCPGQACLLPWPQVGVRGKLRDQVEGTAVGTGFADLGGQLSQCPGARQADGDRPSQRSARRTGRRFGHSPATHTGGLGRCTGTGSNSPAQYPARASRP
jgi:hypothetical protein